RWTNGNRFSIAALTPCSWRFRKAKKHIRDNTIAVFTSDNGPEATWPWQGSSGPWRGYYFTHMEGSLRVPFIIRWPGRVPAGRVSNEIVHEVDTFTTFAKIATHRRRRIAPSTAWIRPIFS